MADVDAKAASHNKEPASPSEFPPKDEDGTEANPTNGVSTTSKGARSAFHLYTLTARPLLEEKYKDDEGDADIDDELARGWDDLAASEKEEYRRKFAAKQEADKEEKDADDETLEKERKSGEKADAQDEDVEMTNYDSEDQDQDGETQLDKDGED